MFNDDSGEPVVQKENIHLLIPIFESIFHFPTFTAVYSVARER